MKTPGDLVVDETSVRCSHLQLNKCAHAVRPYCTVIWTSARNVTVSVLYVIGRLHWATVAAIGCADNRRNLRSSAQPRS